MAGSYNFIIRNGTRGPNGDPLDLRVAVIGKASGIRVAVDEFRAVLADKLDWLSLLTQAPLEIVSPIIAIDWEPGTGPRQFLAFAAQDARTPPLPELTPSIVAQMRRMLELHLPSYVPVAAHLFRAALRARAPEDQFQLFWMAFEGVVEGSARKDRVPVKCQYCGEAAVCHACGMRQERKPMATQAIRERINSIVGADRADKVARALFKLRNTLVHGGSLVDAERWITEKCGYSLESCVNTVGQLAHRVIFDTLHPHLRTGERLEHFLADSFTHGEATLAVNGEINHEGPGEHPSIPEFSLEMVRSNTPFVRSPFGKENG